VVRSAQSTASLSRLTFVESSNEESDFAPDGRWLVYGTSVGSSIKVFVVPVPPTGERWQVSAGGGAMDASSLSRPGWDLDGGAGYERPTLRGVGAAAALPDGARGVPNTMSSM
jgi:hypothetical protein